MDTATDSSTSLSTVEGRIRKAAEVLKADYSDFQELLKEQIGVEPNDEGLRLLNAQTTTEQVIIETLKGCYLPVKNSEKLMLESSKTSLSLPAVAAILKGRNPFATVQDALDKSYKTDTTAKVEKDSSIEGNVIAHQFVELARGLRDPKGMKDRELLELYDKERDYEIEQELHRRANFQHFVVLKPGQEGKTQKAIDIEMSLDLLKRSRRIVNPTLVRQGDIFVNVYRVTELNPEDQIFEICPFCGEIMYDNYCERCGADFGGTGDDEKAFIKLISEKESFDKNSMSDRKAVLASASKGLMDLRITWPKVNKKYEELKMLGELPKLRKSRSLPYSKPADPFHTKDKI